jgi:hypothetical protein
MITKKSLSAFGIILLGAVSAVAQDKPGTIAALEFQTPKNGMVKQYEEGRKQKVDWHKQQKDSQPLYVWETLSGDHTGTYIIGRLDQHWADFDKPSVPEKADLEEFNKVVGASVQSLVTRYYEVLPKLSRPPDSSTVSKYSEIITYHVGNGKEADFRSALERATEAIDKTKWPVHFLWYVLVNGGTGSEYVLVIPHTNWADFEDKPGMKTFAEMLKDAFGQAEADSVRKRFDDSTQSVTSEILEFRTDLSYLPSK